MAGSERVQERVTQSLEATRINVSAVRVAVYGDDTPTAFEEQLLAGEVYHPTKIGVTGGPRSIKSSLVQLIEFRTRLNPEGEAPYLLPGLRTDIQYSLDFGAQEKFDVDRWGNVTGRYDVPGLETPLITPTDVLSVGKLAYKGGPRFFRWITGRSAKEGAEKATKEAAEKVAKEAKVILDTNAVYKHAGGGVKLNPGEVPVQPAAVLQELRNNANRGKMGFPKAANSLEVIPNSGTAEARLAIRQRVIEPTLSHPNSTLEATKNNPGIRGFWADGIIGATGQSTGYPILTFDKKFFDALQKLGIRARNLNIEQK